MAEGIRIAARPVLQRTTHLLLCLTLRDGRQSTRPGWSVPTLVTAVVCWASIPLLVTFGAGAVLATVGATICKPEVLFPGLAVLIASAAVAVVVPLVRRMP